MKLSISLPGIIFALSAAPAMANPLLQRGAVDTKSITLADVAEEVEYHMDSADAVSPIPIRDSIVLPEGKVRSISGRKFIGCSNLVFVSEAQLTAECKFIGTMLFSMDRAQVAAYAEYRIPMGKGDSVSFGADGAFLEKNGEFAAKINIWPAVKSFNGDSKIAVSESAWVLPVFGK